MQSQEKTKVDERQASLATARRVLRENSVLTVATAGDDRLPWASTMYYWSEGLDIYSVVKANARTLEHVRTDPRAFVTIDKAVPDRFLQAEMAVEILGGLDDNARVRDALIEKSPPILGFLRKVPGLVVLRFRPAKLHVTDHTEKMGARITVEPTEAELAPVAGEQRSRALLWWLAGRPFSFTATIVSVLLGTLMAAAGHQASWGLFGIVLVAAVALHAGVNMVSDVFDLRKGVDDWRTFGSSRMIVDGHLSPRAVLAGGLFLIGAASALGLLLVTISGQTILWIGLAGVALGLLYTGGGLLGLKYLALGDIAVFLAFGPLMAAGAYAAQTGGWTWDVVLVSLPVAFLVDGILHANNLRDIEDDRRAGAVTFAGLLGLKVSQGFYVGLVVAAYGSLVALVAAGLVSPWALLAFLTLPLAARNVRIIRNPAAPLFSAGDQLTAQLHLAFGMLMSVGLLLGILIPA